MSTVDPTASRTLRRPYIAILALFLLLLAFIRFTFLRAAGVTVQDSLVATGAQVTDALIGTTIAALGVAFLFVVIFRDRTEKDLEELHSNERAEFLRREASNTREWCVRALTAANFLSQVLPFLQRSSQTHNRAIVIRVVLMDPRNEGLIDRHRESYLSGESAPPRRRFDLERCAALLDLASQAATHPQLDISVRLTRSTWATLLDITSHYAIVSGPRDSDSAITYSAQSRFSDVMRSDFEISFSAGRPVDLAALKSTDFRSLENIRSALQVFEMADVLSELDDLDLIRGMLRYPGPLKNR